MQHLLCLTPDDLYAFMIVTEMEILVFNPETIIIKGESIFTYVYDISKEMYCFTKGIVI